MKLPDVVITKPFPNVVLTVRVSRMFYIRLRIVQVLITLAAWVGGAQLEWDMESDEW